jgi:LCP family protein required for cell wall assembly
VRFLIAAVGVVLLSAAATATIALNEVSKLVEALGQNRAVHLSPQTLAPTTRGAPQTLLLVGDDRRPPPKSNPNAFVLPHSNEMLLVRIDPGKPAVSMLSIPRELRVPIIPPGGGAPIYNRINFAYTLGGIQLMTETIKRILGVRVNHVFVVTFPKFKRAVGEMGCVYMTVDRRYYHVNEPGGEQYFEVNLQPGYQKLCGRQALEFVANRHEDTSLTRDARDQRFLLEVKAQYGPTLFENREKFERILGRAVETDLHGSSQVLDLLELLVSSEGKPVRQVPFQVNLGPSFDTATPQQIQESVHAFLNGTTAVSHAAPHPPVASHSSHGHAHRGSGVVLAASPAAGMAEARTQAPSFPFALEYPRARDSTGAGLADSFRRYYIRDQQGRLHQIYTIVIDRGPLGQFYNVQGTDWSDPPLLANPGATVHVGSRTYDLFYAGEQVRLIAWHEGGAAYWIQNTLGNDVSPRAMIATAEQTVPVVGSVTASAAASNVPVNVPPPPPRAVAKTGLATKIGSVFGFIGLAVVAGLGLLLLRRQRELSGLREQVGRAMALEALQRPALAGAAAGAGVAAGQGVAPAAPVAAGSPAPAGATAAAVTPAAGAPAPAGEVPTTPAFAETRPTIYRARFSRPRLLAVAAAALVIAALAVFGVTRLLSGSSGPRSAGAAVVPVAVFNATGSAATAHHVAHELRVAHLHIAAVGGLNAGLGRGAFVLYPPNARAEAAKVASLLPSLSPTVTPMPPQVSSAVAGRDEIVVVLD